MEEIYVLEECLALGVWTLCSETFYISKKEAEEIRLKMIESMKKLNKKGFIIRVTTLKQLKNKEEK